MIALRRASLLLRRYRSNKEGRQILRYFNEWRLLQRSLAAPHPVEKRLLIVRLDDIGDYLLFRNQLGMYKNSARWQGHAITLLGNLAWKELFTALDAQGVDDALWLDKKRYLESADYRLQIWRRLREKGFEIVIAPARTRPLLLDDLCMLAAAPRLGIGSANTYAHASWNAASDALYQKVFSGSAAGAHEFVFNGEFAAWICGQRYPGARPGIEHPFKAPHAGPYILCFVGANTRSKRWPAQRWIEFIHRYRQTNAAAVILAGGSAAEIGMAETIRQQTDAQSIAGKASLLELLHWVAGADAVCTNDTMAAHLGASCGRPTIIVANGVNHDRFTEYAKAGIDRVATVYPDVFTRQRDAHVGEFIYRYTDALSADIASIRADTVLQSMRDLRSRG